MQKRPRFHKNLFAFFQCTASAEWRRNMGITESYLTILADSLDKKLEILEQLIIINAEQSKLIKATQFDDEAYYALAEKKDVCIESINKLDDGFQMIYDKVKAELEANSSVHAEKIKEMKLKISKIVELSNHIQVEEKHNFDAVKRQINKMKEDVKQSKVSQKMVASYYKNINYASEPVFMDKKK